MYVYIRMYVSYVCMYVCIYIWLTNVRGMTQPRRVAATSVAKRMLTYADVC